MEQSYFTANQINWDERSHIHADSEMYGLDKMRSNPDFLTGVVEFDKKYLGDLNGLDILHLQCHIGTDTLSLARLGANVTGLDQSPESIKNARKLFADTSTTGHFEIANLYDSVGALGQQYDLIYTGVGALNWLPNITRWAETVDALLKPGGRLYLREGHPMLYALLDTTDGTLQVGYPYFEVDEPMVFDEKITYTGDTTEVKNTRTYEWNHGLAEVIMSLINRKMKLLQFDEHDGLEWKMFPQMVLENGQYKLPHHQRSMVPLMYSLLVEKT